MRELGIISDTWDGLRPTAIEPWMLAFLEFAATNPDFRFGLLSDGYLRTLNEMYKSSHSPPVLRRLSTEARARGYPGMGGPGAVVGSPRLRVYSPHVAAGLTAGPPPAAPPGQHVSGHQQFRPREAAPPSLATGLNLRDGGDGVLASGWTYQGTGGSLPPPWTGSQRGDGYHLVRGDGYQSLVRAPTAGGGPVPTSSTSSASVGYGHGYSIGGYSKIGLGAIAEPAFFHPCGYTSSHSAVILPDGMPDGAAAHGLTMQPPLGSVVRLPDGTSLSSRDLVSASGGLLSRQHSTSTAHEQYDSHACTGISAYPCTAPRDTNHSMLKRVRSLPTLVNEPHRGSCSHLPSRPEPRGLLSRSLGATTSDGGAPASYAGSGGNGGSGGSGMAIESFRAWEARRMSHREHEALHRVEMPPPNTAPPLRSLAVGAHTGLGSSGGGGGGVMRPRRRSAEGANGPTAPTTAPGIPSAPPTTAPAPTDFHLSCPPTATLFLPPSRGLQGSGLLSCASANSFSPAGSTSSPSLLPLRRPPKAPAENRWHTSSYYGVHSSSQHPSSFVLGPTPHNSAEGSALTGGSGGVEHACLAHGTPLFGTLDRPRTGAALPKPVVGTACFDSRQVLSRWATRYVETPRPGATRAEHDTSGLVPPTRGERKASNPYL